VPWDREERYDMPVSTWQSLIDQHFPNTGWVRLSRDTIDALAAYRSAHGLLGFDDAVCSLLTTTAAGDLP
jgi:cytochrome c-type biogenesis protein CcmH/NrfG